MKLDKSYYGHESIPDPKFESSISSSFGDMTSQNFRQKKRNKSSNLALNPWKTALTLKKKEFYVQNRSSRSKIDPPPHVNFSNFQAEENIFIL